MSNIARKKQTSDLSGPGTGVSGGQFATHTGGAGDVDADLEIGEAGPTRQETITELSTLIRQHAPQAGPRSVVLTFGGTQGTDRDDYVGLEFVDRGLLTPSEYEVQEKIRRVADRIGTDPQAWADLIVDGEEPTLTDYGDGFFTSEQWLDVDRLHRLGSGRSMAQIRGEAEADRIRVLVEQQQAEVEHAQKTLQRLVAGEVSHRARVVHPDAVKVLVRRWDGESGGGSSWELVGVADANNTELPAGQEEDTRALAQLLHHFDPRLDDQYRLSCVHDDPGHGEVWSWMLDEVPDTMRA